MIILMVFINVYLYIIVPKGFFPQQDTGRLSGTIMGDQDVSFPAMKAKTNEFIRIVRKDPRIQDVMAFVGGNTAQNQGRMFAAPEAAIGTQGQCRPGDRAPAP